MEDLRQYTVSPTVMGTIGDTYENGMHKGLFPPTPWSVLCLIKYLYERRYAGNWRFSPCDGFGKPDPLMFLE